MLVKLIKLIILFFPFCVNAAQLITVLNNGESIAQIASGALNRLYVANDAINKITSISGELFIEKDIDNGQVYIKPVDEHRNKPIEIFITTDSGVNFSVSLEPVDVQAQNVGFQIKNKEIKSTKHIDDIAVTLIKTLAKGLGENLNLSISDGNQGVIGWAENNGFIAEALLLPNSGSAEIKINLNEFMADNVVAIAVDKKILMPGESAKIYWVKYYG